MPSAAHGEPRIPFVPAAPGACAHSRPAAWPARPKPQVKADIAREPPQNLRQLVKRAAWQRRRHDHQLDQQPSLDAEHPAAAAVTHFNDAGKVTPVLPDFCIGVHAAVNGYAILTRDMARYRSYFFPPVL